MFYLLLGFTTSQFSTSALLCSSLRNQGIFVSSRLFSFMVLFLLRLGFSRRSRSLRSDMIRSRRMRRSSGHRPSNSSLRCYFRGDRQYTSPTLRKQKASEPVPQHSSRKTKPTVQPKVGLKDLRVTITRITGAEATYREATFWRKMGREGPCT